MPRPSMILRASATCSALDLASLPLPAHRLSSRPTRILPPSAAAWAAMRNCAAPAPSTDQRKLSPKRRSAARFIWATSSAGGDVDDGPDRLLDARQEALEGFRRLVGLAGLRIARMEM